MRSESDVCALLPGDLLDLLSRHRGLAALYDGDDRLRWANPEFKVVFDIQPDAQPTWSDLMRHCHRNRIGALCQTDDFEHWLASAASRRGKQPYRQFEADLHDGRWVLMSQTTDDRGWVLELGMDVSDMGCDARTLRQARDRALRASQEDNLTGVANRAAVLAQLDTELAAPGARPCVALLDLDHFKQVNDGYGHAAGDRVLRDFAQRLRDGLRRVDACGRWGGEEFLLVLHDLEPSEAEDVLQRLLAQTRRAQPLPGAPGFRYSASAGVVRADPGESRESLLARADAALYVAKRSGRDRCVLGSPDTVTVPALPGPMLPMAPMSAAPPAARSGFGSLN